MKDDGALYWRLPSGWCSGNAVDRSLHGSRQKASTPNLCGSSGCGGRARVSPPMSTRNGASSHAPTR
eukprot:10176948-Lingulodinium_polyedra.AAC.1